MLKTRLLHPVMLDALGRSGHGSQVLVADGNFAFASRRGPHARVVYLNLTADVPTVDTVLSVLLDTVPVQAATLMQPPDPEAAPVQALLRRMLPCGVSVQALDRAAFYDAAGSPLTTLVVATGDTRRYANVLLTLGVAGRAAPPGDQNFMRRPSE